MPKTELRCACGRTLSSAAAGAYGRRKLGRIEKPSAVKLERGRLTVQIALAVRMGNLARADELRRLHCPELVRRRELEAQRKQSDNHDT